MPITRRGVRGGGGRRNRNFKPGPKRNNASNPAAKTGSSNPDEPGQKPENQNPVVGPRFQVIEIKNDAAVNENNEALALPFKVKVTNLPSTYNLADFVDYFESTFNVPIKKIITPARNSYWVVIPFETKEEQDNFIRLVNNHVWRKRVLQVAEFQESLKRKAEDGGEDPETKKIKVEEVPALTLEEEILSENLPLHSIPYEEQNRQTVLDAEILSNKLHAYMCEKNPDLAGWAEAMCEQNGGFLYKIDPLKPSPFLVGYRNKCKFRVGKNADGEIAVGLCLNDNENKIVGVQPGDKLIHLPDSMKFAAKKFEDFVKTTGKEPYNRKSSGFWDHIFVRIAPEGDLMLVVVMYHNKQTDEQINQIKTDIKTFFTSGDGKECNLFSLYFQILNDKPPLLPPDKLELLIGEPSFDEIICGLRFHVGPFTIINVNSPSAEIVYNSIIEVAQPTSDSIVLDLCAGTGGIAFTIADKCEKVIAIESQEDQVNDALKTMKMNEITNVEFIKGRVENELSKVFEKFKDKNIIPIVDPPRQGLVARAISQLRANENIKKLVYVTCNSKMGIKNFLDLCVPAGKKEGNVELVGLPFLPVKVVPIDVAPYTVNNTMVMLFERIDPSTFPPAKNPPPVPVKKFETKKEHDRKTRRKFRGGRVDGRNGQQGNRSDSRKPGKPNTGNRFNSPPNRRGSNRPPNPKNERGRNFNQGGRNNRFPPPLMGGPMDPGVNNLVAKYEKRIAELEQDNMAFKAGLAMGFQHALQQGGGGGGGGGNFNPGFGNQGEFSQQSDSSFGNFQNNFNQGYSGNPWLSNQGPQGSVGSNQLASNFGNNPGNAGNFGSSNMGNGFGGNNFGNFGGYNRRNNSGGNSSKGFGGGAKKGGGPKPKGGGGNFRNKQGNKPRR